MRRLTRRRFLQVVGGIAGPLATITDMYAKAIQGMAPEEAVKWAPGELTKVYT